MWHTTVVELEDAVDYCSLINLAKIRFKIRLQKLNLLYWQPNLFLQERAKNTLSFFNNLF